MGNQNTKTQILDAACRLIHLRGFNNTSIDDILRECGIGKGNFYYYFKSKDELGYAALERSVEAIKQELIERSFGGEGDPWDQLATFLAYPVERARAASCAGGCPLGNLAVEMSDIHEGFRRRIQAAFEEVRGHLEACLDRARQAETLQPGTDIRRLAHFLLASFEGAFLMGKLHQDPEMVASIIQELAGHLAHCRVTAPCAVA